MPGNAAFAILVQHLKVRQVEIESSLPTTISKNGKVSEVTTIYQYIELEHIHVLHNILQLTLEPLHGKGFYFCSTRDAAYSPYRILVPSRNFCQKITSTSHSIAK